MSERDFLALRQTASARIWHDAYVCTVCRRRAAAFVLVIKLYMHPHVCTFEARERGVRIVVAAELWALDYVPSQPVSHACSAVLVPARFTRHGSCACA